MDFFSKKHKSMPKNDESSFLVRVRPAPDTDLPFVLPVREESEIASYDRHIRVEKGKKWPAIIPDHADWDVLQCYFDAFFSNYVTDNWGQKNILRKYFHAMLPDLLKTCSSIDGDREEIWKDVKSAVHHNEEARNKTGLSNIVPPDTIHRMQKGDPLWIGDIYSAEMVAESLESARLNIEKQQNYLDFGCSSGSLIRILKAAYPESHFYGVDPIQSAVNWAHTNIPGAAISVSSESPPLDFADNMFSGVTAISIWSHFADFSALDWFNEMHRIIKPDGWLFFTTHGLNALLYHLKRKQKSPKRVKALLEGLLGSDFVFEEMFLPRKEGDTLLEVAWGNSYFRPDWIMKTVCDKWDIVFYNQGKNQNHQDAYILKAKT